MKNFLTCFFDCVIDDSHVPEQPIQGRCHKTVDPGLYLIKGSAKKMIPKPVNDISADLVVMGAIPRTGISGFIMGNTAEAVFNQLQCSILAVKPPGFKFPVKSK